MVDGRSDLAIDSGRMVRAAVSAMLAVPLLTGAVIGQAAQDYDPSQMAAQKAKMLKGLLASERLAQARQSHPQDVADLEAQAMLSFGLAENALERSEVDQAMVHLDEAIRVISQAAAMASAAETPDEDALAREYESRRRNAEMYLASMESMDALTDEDRAFSGALREELLRSEEMYANGDVQAASEALDTSYRVIIQLVSQSMRGGSLFIERIFETPEEEFEYELERNKNYELLVGIMLEEKAGESAGLVQLAADLTAQSNDLRERAVGEAGAGDGIAAIKTIERSTELFIVVLRGGGLVLTE